MESQTQIKNIIGTDHKKIEMLISSLEDTLNDKTAWIMICLILFEFFLMIVIGTWIVFTFSMIKKRRQCEIEKVRQPSICYDVAECQEVESQISR